MVNAGDLIKDMTNGYWKSCVHRVRDIEAGSGAASRAGGSGKESLISIAFFSGPSNGTLVEIADSAKCRECGRLDEGSLNNLGITAGEHLMRKINASNVSK